MARPGANQGSSGRSLAAPAASVRVEQLARRMQDTRPAACADATRAALSRSGRRPALPVEPGIEHPASPRARLRSRPAPPRPARRRGRRPGRSRRRPPPPAPPTAATPRRTRATASSLPARSSVTLTTTAALPSLTLTSATTPEPSSFLIASAVPRSSLAGTPSSVRAAKRMLAHLLEAVAPPSLPPTASLRRRSAASRSSRRRSSSSASSRAGRSAGGDLEALRQALQQIVLAAGLLEGQLAGHRLDPADAGRDGALGR